MTDKELKVLAKQVIEAVNEVNIVLERIVDRQKRWNKVLDTIKSF